MKLEKYYTLIEKLEIVDIFESYKTKKIHCIKDYSIFKRGGFYILNTIMYNSNLDNNYNTIEILEITIIINTGGEPHSFFISYDDFSEYFELKTKEEIRRRKIKSILND